MEVEGREMIAPLVGADRARMEALRPHAVMVARHYGCLVRLVRFSHAETVDVIDAREMLSRPESPFLDRLDADADGRCHRCGALLPAGGRLCEACRDEVV
jgi:hypothetical protein